MNWRTDPSYKLAIPLHSSPRGLKAPPTVKKKSDAKKIEDRERVKCMKVVRARSKGRCELRIPNICTVKAAEGHELTPRSGQGSPIDPENVRDACRDCHQWAHSHPKEAMKIGAKISRYQTKGATK